MCVLNLRAEARCAVIGRRYHLCLPRPTSRGVAVRWTWLGLLCPHSCFSRHRASNLSKYSWPCGQRAHISVGGPEFVALSRPFLFYSFLCECFYFCVCREFFLTFIFIRYCAGQNVPFLRTGSLTSVFFCYFCMLFMFTNDKNFQIVKQFIYFSSGIVPESLLCTPPYV